MTERMTNYEGNGDLIRPETFERRVEAESVMALRGIIKMRPDVKDHLNPKFVKTTLQAPNGQKLEVLTDPRSEVLKKFNTVDSFDGFKNSLEEVFGDEYPHILEVAREDLDLYFDNFTDRYRDSEDEHREDIDHIYTQIKPRTIEMLNQLSPVSEKEFAVTG